MSNQNRVPQIKEKIRQTLETLEEALTGWLNKNRPTMQPVPIPVDSRYKNRRVA